MNFLQLLLCFYPAVLVISLSPALAENDKLEPVREYLVYPKPLMVTLPARLDKKNNRFDRLIDYLKKKGLVRLKETGDEIIIETTPHGEEFLVANLNLANYQVYAWKLRLGTQDIEFEKMISNHIIAGRKVVVNKGRYYEDVLALLPQDESSLLNKVSCTWDIRDLTSIIESCR